MTSSPSPRSRVYFTWRKTLSNAAALLAFAIIAFLGILGESVGAPQTRHLCAFGLGALDLAFAAFLVRMLCRERSDAARSWPLRPLLLGVYVAGALGRAGAHVSGLSSGFLTSRTPRASASSRSSSPTACIAFMNFVAAITTVAVLRRAIGLSSRLNVRTLMVLNLLLDGGEQFQVA